jgi:hypothetical protein
MERVRIWWPLLKTWLRIQPEKKVPGYKFCWQEELLYLGFPNHEPIHLFNTLAKYLLQSKPHRGI